MMQELGHDVTGIARTHKEAIESVRKKRPGLVLADIHLADGSSGLAAVNEILTSINVPVIFITAFPERLLTGERPEPTFLITKPFQADTVRATVSQALFFDSRPRVPKSRPPAHRGVNRRAIRRKVLGGDLCVNVDRAGGARAGATRPARVCA